WNRRRRESRRPGEAREFHEFSDPSFCASRECVEEPGKVMTALLLLSHQSAPCVNRMIRYWRERTRPDHIVVAYGGPDEEFDGIEGDKVFIDDPRLRTKDHQRECQSYHQVLSAAVALLENRSWEQLY